MHAGQETKMLRGAIWACAVPMALGLAGLALEIGRLPENLTWDDFNVMGFHWSAPFLACFIFGTPFVAWMAFRHLRRIKNPANVRRWKASALAGLRAASLTHFGAAAAYSIWTYIFMDVIAAAKVEQWEKTETMLFSAIGNLILWLFITLPLSLLCATIFWRVTKFPKDTSVF